jgi:hypothetical protein
MKFEKISEECRLDGSCTRLLHGFDGEVRLQCFDEDDNAQGSMLSINPDGTLFSVSSDGTLIRYFSLDPETGLKLDRQEIVNPGATTPAVLRGEELFERASVDSETEEQTLEIVTEEMAEEEEGEELFPVLVTLNEFNMLTKASL